MPYSEKVQRFYDDLKLLFRDRLEFNTNFTIDPFERDKLITEYADQFMEGMAPEDIQALEALPLGGIKSDPKSVAISTGGRLFCPVCGRRKMFGRHGNAFCSKKSTAPGRLPSTYW